MSENMINLSDGLYGIKTVPHIDCEEAGYMAAKNLIRKIRGEVNPQMYLKRIPLLIPSSSLFFSIPICYGIGGSSGIRFRSNHLVGHRAAHRCLFYLQEDFINEKVFSQNHISLYYHSHPYHHRDSVRVCRDGLGRNQEGFRYAELLQARLHL